MTYREYADWMISSIMLKLGLETPEEAIEYLKSGTKMSKSDRVHSKRESGEE